MKWSILINSSDNTLDQLLKNKSDGIYLKIPKDIILGIMVCEPDRNEE